MPHRCEVVSSPTVGQLSWEISRGGIGPISRLPKGSLGAAGQGTVRAEAMALEAVKRIVGCLGRMREQHQPVGRLQRARRPAGLGVAAWQLGSAKAVLRLFPQAA